MYLGDNENYPRIHQKINDRWEIVATVNSDEKFEHVSFVNGINTYRGGKHVSYIADQIKRQMTELIKKKNKVTIRPQYVVDQLLVFVKCQIVNPAFDSQTKETLNTNIKKFGSTCEIDKKFIERLANDTDLVERVLTQNEYKNNKSLKKTDGKKRMRIKVPKLDDANWAGGRKSKQCTLILTEGDSA